MFDALKKRLPASARVRVWSARRRAHEAASAVRGGEAGFCPTCGRRTRFSIRDGRHREGVRCLFCGSSSRNRHLALAVLRFVGCREIRSLRDLAGRRAHDVFVTAASGSTASQLCRSPRVVLSEYWDDVAPGTRRGGVLCQDLERLTFATERFDLVISEDVFEHVRDYRQGFREVWRVLRYGGAHVFTVPYRAEAPTIDRFARVNGRLVPVMPVEIHYDGLRNGIPAVTTFGYDLVDTLREIGFDTAMCPARADEIKDCRTYMSLSFVSVKRTPGGAVSAGAAAARPREASRR